MHRYHLELNIQTENILNGSFYVLLVMHLLHSAVHTVCGRNFKTEKSIKHNKETPRHLLGIKNWDPKELMMKDLVDKEMGRSGCCFLLVSFFFFSFLFFFLCLQNNFIIVNDNYYNVNYFMLVCYPSRTDSVVGLQLYPVYPNKIVLFLLISYY